MMVLLGMAFSPPPAPTTYQFKVIKVAGVWKVVNATDYTKTKLKVKKKDTIIWTVEGTNAYFQFPTNLFDKAATADSLAGGYTKFVKKGKRLKLKIRANALSGTYDYAVFCTTAGAFAIGGSPPRIIIE